MAESTKPTRRVFRFHQEGGPETLRIEDAPVSAPGPNEVRVRIEAIGLNRAEALYRGGTYYERAERFPAGLGYEAAGAIDALGADVASSPDLRDLRVGDAVSVIPAFSQRDYGMYADIALVPAHAVVPRPAGQEATAGAAVWMSCLTAYGGLVEVGELRAGDTALVTAATGSIGIAAIQIGKRTGASVIATTRDPAKKKRLLDAGADYVVVTTEEELAARVLELTSGRGAEVVFDPIGGGGTTELGRATAANGKLIVYGFLDQSTVPGSFGTTVTPLPLTNWSIWVRWFAAQDVSRDPERLRRAKRYILSGLTDGSLRPLVDRTFPFEQMAEAHRYLEGNGQVGKVVVTVDHGASTRPAT